MNNQTAIANRLNDGQKECLRLVMLHNSSKQIARELGISPHTVDKRLKQAIAALGVSSRVDAARILSAHEADGYQPLVYPRPDLFPGKIVDNLKTSSGERYTLDDKADRTLHEAQASFDSRSSRQTNNRFLELVTGRDTQANDLSVQARVLAMLTIIGGSVLIFAVFVSVLEGLSRLY